MPAGGRPRCRPGTLGPLRALAVAVAGLVLAAGCTARRHGVAAVTPPPTTASTTTSSTTTTTAVPATTTTTARPADLAWAGCGDGFVCAKAHVPVDYARPGGPTFDLAVIRLPASGPRAGRIGSLLVNPGGPGAAAVAFARTVRHLLPASVLARFDLVGFDPRGVGDSAGISCEDGPGLDRFFGLDPSPDTPAEHDAAVNGSIEFARQCARRSGNLLAHVDTRTAAKDMDFVRASLGDDTLSFLGFSYGTYLGAMYADMFPTRVRAFVLDGAIDPTIGGMEGNRLQAIGFEHSLAAFLSDCAARPACPFHSDGDPRGALDRLVARIEADPLPAGAGGRTVGPGELVFAVAAPLYRPGDWPRLAQALDQGARQGRGDLLLQLSDTYTQRRSDGSYGTLLSANTAVNCVDRPWPRRVEEYDADASVFAHDAPFFGAALAYGNLPCAFWPVAPVDTPHPLRAAGAPPIVVIGSTGDPATPFAAAQALASQIQSGVLVTRVGEGHTSVAANNSCIRRAVEAYLVGLAVPQKGLSCKDD